MDVIHRFLERACNYRRDLTGVILIPLKSCLLLGMSILGRGVTWALFHEEGHLLVFRETFQITRLTGKRPAAAIKEKGVMAKRSTLYSRAVGVNEKKYPPMSMFVIFTNLVNLRV